MLKKLWKKTIDSAVVLNNRLLNNFRCSSSSEYAKISPENGDGFICTIEEQKRGGNKVIYNTDGIIYLQLLNLLYRNIILVLRRSC